MTRKVVKLPEKLIYPVGGGVGTPPAGEEGGGEGGNSIRVTLAASAAQRKFGEAINRRPQRSDVGG